MDDYKVDLESILYSYFIKYGSLIGLLNPLIICRDPNKIDIYIDIYNFIKPVYIKPIISSKKFVIVSQIINLAAHIRGFFRSRYNIPTRIFLVYANETSISHRQYLADFGDDAYKFTLNYNEIHSIVQSQLSLLKILVAYINEVYYIEKTVDFSTFVYSHSAECPDRLTFAITKNSYAYQLPAMNPNIYLLRPKKNAGLVGHYYAITKYYGSVNSKIIKENLCKIPPQLLSIMMTLTGIKDNKVKKICNVTSASSIMVKAINNNQIYIGHNSDIEYVYKSLPCIDKLVSLEDFKNRFLAIDLLYQRVLYDNSIEFMDISWRVDYYDPETVKNINNNYFIDNPLDLNNL